MTCSYLVPDFFLTAQVKHSGGRLHNIITHMVISGIKTNRQTYSDWMDEKKKAVADTML